MVPSCNPNALLSQIHVIKVPLILFWNSGEVKFDPMVISSGYWIDETVIWLLPYEEPLIAIVTFSFVTFILIWLNLSWWVKISIALFRNLGCVLKSIVQNLLYILYYIYMNVTLFFPKWNMSIKTRVFIRENKVARQEKWKNYLVIFIYKKHCKFWR